MRARRSRERSERRGGPAEALLGERSARRGGGPEAEVTAGNMQQRGELYFLVKKR